MPYSAHDVALILSGEDWLGTGTLVAPGRILTAYHVVFNEHGQVKPDLRVRLHGEAKAASATVVWAGSLTLDVAVLECTVERKPVTHPLVGLSGESITTDTPWEARGYPAVRDNQPSTRMEQVRGKAASFGRGDERINLDVDAAPDKFNGLSGGAVIIRERIVGVVRAVPMNWGGKRLEATPAAVFVDNPAFRAAIGVTGEDEQYAKDLEALKRKIATELEKTSDLRTALGEKLKCAATPHEIVETMVRTRACEVAQTLVDLDFTLAQERERIQLILWRVLPFCVDWYAVLLAARRATAAGENAVDCSIHSLTIAEVILAGMDGRPCDFMHEAGEPRGTAQLSTPVEAYSPLFFNSNEGGERLVDTIVDGWFKEQEPLLNSIFGTAERRPDDPVVRRRIKAKFANLARPNNPERHSRYVVFRDDEWKGEAGQMDNLWRLAGVALKAQFPSLHLVRVRKGEDAPEEDDTTIEQIHAFLARRREKG